jgi:hypothetical protein
VPPPTHKQCANFHYLLPSLHADIHVHKMYYIFILTIKYVIPDATFRLMLICVWYKSEGKAFPLQAYEAQRVLGG